MAEERVDLKALLVERSRDLATANQVVDAVLACLSDPKVKPGDAMKVLDIFLKYQEEDAAAGGSLPGMDELDFGQYSDEELRSMLARLMDTGGEETTVPEAAPAPESGSHGVGESGVVRLRLEDFLNG